MQGLSKSKHVHLVDALRHLESLLNGREQECECLPQTAALRRELESMHGNYERLLDELAKQITDYEVLYSHVKIQFLGRKLKELKKEMTTEQPDFVAMVDGIRLAYGT